MQTTSEELELELNDLRNKYIKLVNFLVSLEFCELSIEEKNDLLDQREHMLKYIEALERRTARSYIETSNT